MQARLDGKEPYKVLACDGYGVVPSDYMFVGISAGRLGALLTKVPFTKDASGRIFQRMLGMLGLSRSDECCIKPDLVNCYLTNLVKGIILSDTEKNRRPRQYEIDYWIPTLKREVDDVKPRIIVAVGKLVYENILRMGSLGTSIMLKKAYHPRWYFSHGALDPDSDAFAKMVSDYKALLSLNDLSTL